MRSYPAERVVFGRVAARFFERCLPVWISHCNHRPEVLRDLGELSADLVYGTVSGYPVGRLGRLEHRCQGLAGYHPHDEACKIDKRRRLRAGRQDGQETPCLVQVALGRVGLHHLGRSW